MAWQNHTQSHMVLEPFFCTGLPVQGSRCGSGSSKAYASGVQGLKVADSVYRGGLERCPGNSSNALRQHTLSRATLSHDCGRQGDHLPYGRCLRVGVRDVRSLLRLGLDSDLVTSMPVFIKGPDILLRFVRAVGLRCNHFVYAEL